MDAAANALFEEWDHRHRDAVAALSDLRRERYREIKAQAPDPQETSLVLPRRRLEDFQELDPNAQLTLAPLVDKHLMSDEDGNPNAVVESDQTCCACFLPRSSA